MTDQIAIDRNAERRAESVRRALLLAGPPEGGFEPVAQEGATPTSPVRSS
jgi:hypothetical protein